MAIYKVFGVGIAYDFDHMSKPKDGEPITSRRMQARAAKSAVRRLQTITEAAKNAQNRAARISDPYKRNKQRLEIDEWLQNETDFLRRQLVDLIPVDNSGDFTVETSFFTPKKRYKRISQTEMMVIEEEPEEPSPGERRMASVYPNLMKRMKKKDDEDSEVLPSWATDTEEAQQRDGPEGSNTTTNDTSEPRDDEFIDAWKEDQGKGKADDNDRTLLA